MSKKELLECTQCKSIHLAEIGDKCPTCDEEGEQGYMDELTPSLIKN